MVRASSDGAFLPSRIDDAMERWSLAGRQAAVTARKDLDRVGFGHLGKIIAASACVDRSQKALGSGLLLRFHSILLQQTTKRD